MGARIIEITLTLASFLGWLACFRQFVKSLGEEDGQTRTQMSQLSTTLWWIVLWLVVVGLIWLMGRE